MKSAPENEFTLTPLYQLPIYGANTDAVESICSHLQRLAHAHRVTIYKILRQLLDGSTPSAPFERERSHRINSGCKISVTIRKALERDTGHSTLQQCTLEFLWSGFGSSVNGLLSPTRRWCDDCFHDDLRQYGEVYDRLIWSFKLVSHCVRHRNELSSRCGNCGILQPYFVSHTELANCYECGCALFLRRREMRPADHATEQKIAVSNQYYKLLQVRNESWKSWHSSAIGEFIGRVKVLHGLTNCELAKSLAVGHSLISHWHRANQLPRLDFFLDICMNFGVCPVVMLTDPTMAARTAIIPDRPFAEFRIKRTRRRGRGSLKQLRQLVDLALRLEPGNPKSSPVWIAQQAKVSMGDVYYHFETEMNFLSERNRRYRQRLAAKQLRNAVSLVKREISKRIRRGEAHGAKILVSALHRDYEISITCLRKAYDVVVR